jgi:hypothetical protein
MNLSVLFGVLYRLIMGICQRNTRVALKRFKIEAEGRV